MDNEFVRLLADLPGPDAVSAAVVADRAANVLRPLGALARLDEVAVWLASWQRTPRPAVTKPHLIVFVGDHGVTNEGVSAYPAEVTQAMLKALSEGVATATAMAEAIGATIDVVDVGVGRPTGNLVHEPALSEEGFLECFERGRQTVADADTDLLVFGEMGIGNTTPAAAITAALLGCAAEDCTGRGTGVDDAALANKRRVVDAARTRIAGASPLEVLREVGGSELVAIAGAAFEARMRSVPVVLDGFVVCASVAPLHAADSGALDHCIAGHRSPEPGHRLLLDAFGKRPLLDLEMRLGEGSGALAAVPLVKLAAAAVTDVATFQEWGVEGR
jgi:nicotinate-nucleotide--dimethylbenzimidazole phosphoribosyltransferase